MRNTKETALPFKVAFVRVVEVTKRGGADVMFGDVGAEGLLGAEDGIAEIGFLDGFPSEGYEKRSGSIRDMVDVDFRCGDRKSFGVWGEKG